MDILLIFSFVFLLQSFQICHACNASLELNWESFLSGSVTLFPTLGSSWGTDSSRCDCGKVGHLFCDTAHRNLRHCPHTPTSACLRTRVYVLQSVPYSLPSLWLACLALSCVVVGETNGQDHSTGGSALNNRGLNTRDRGSFITPCDQKVVFCEASSQSVSQLTLTNSGGL